MRAHGDPSFPDPVAPGTAPGKTTYLGNGPNPNTTPRLRDAEQACRKYADATPVTPAGARQVEAQQLRYAKCMRGHGVLQFPDPSPAGGFTIPSSVDQNSPTFQAAENACKGSFGVPGVSGS